MLLLFMSCSNEKRQKIPVSTLYESPSTEINVYICTGPSSKKFHYNESCDGLSSCSREVECITLEQAENMGRTPCKRCYKEDVETN